VARTGEQIQQLGEQGAQRAKRWLESTCRAEVKWNNPTIGLKKLTFRKAGAPDDSEAQGDWFSFDLGGTFLGGDANGEVFLAECKKYAAAGDQGIEYRKFLAKCYRVESEHGAFHDRYLWVTWAPFSITSWPGLMTPAYVEESVTKDQERIRIALGDAAFDATVGTAVAEKLLIVVLSDGQEVLLSLHGDELMHVRKALLEFRSTA
jgi:hypothetical protein